MTKHDWVVLADILRSVERAICAAAHGKHDAAHEHMERALHHADEGLRNAPR